jgi:hypothetical protein
VPRSDGESAAIHKVIASVNLPHDFELLEGTSQSTAGKIIDPFHAVSITAVDIKTLHRASLASLGTSTGT